MTRSDIKYILKRFRHIKSAIIKGISELTIYVSKRRENIIITHEIEVCVELIEKIYEVEKGEFFGTIINEIITGKEDIEIITNNPISRTSYYSLKDDLIWKILCCCAVKGLVTTEEILFDEKANQTKEENYERAGNIVENYFGTENDAIGNKER